ncbi:MAG: hypothetical protein P8K80_09800 [Phycisphaerales bacterium]|nr:hypothetical protein [Phycisphaerales bacterium]
MDRERLKDVQTSSMNDDRLNEDFVVWLKTKGPTWLLMILIAVVAYLYIVNWKQGQINYRNEAWIALSEAQLPTSLEDVAVQYPDVDSVGQQARIRAASMYLQSALLSRGIGSTTENPIALGAEDRVFNLERAAALYQDVVNADTGDEGDTVIAYTAMNGLAAVSESKGDLADAASWYRKAAERSKSTFPYLSQRAQVRAENCDQYDQLVVLPESLPEDASLEGFIPSIDDNRPSSVEDVTNILTLPDFQAPTADPVTPAEEPGDQP